MGKRQCCSSEIYENRYESQKAEGAIGKAQRWRWEKISFGREQKGKVSKSQKAEGTMGKVRELMKKNPATPLVG